jgi:hypothetical protein
LPQKLNEAQHQLDDRALNIIRIGIPAREGARGDARGERTGRARPRGFAPPSAAGRAGGRRRSLSGGRPPAFQTRSSFRRMLTKL